MHHHDASLKESLQHGHWCSRGNEAESDRHESRDSAGNFGSRASTTRNSQSTTRILSQALRLLRPRNF